MKNIPIEKMDERRLRVELSSSVAVNQILNELLANTKAEVRTLQKAREREKYTLRQTRKNAERLNIQISGMRESVQKLDALEAAGVDNWDGYDYAMELMEEVEDET